MKKKKIFDFFFKWPEPDERLEKLVIRPHFFILCLLPCQILKGTHHGIIRIPSRRLSRICFLVILIIPWCDGYFNYILTYSTVSFFLFNFFLTNLNLNMYTTFWKGDVKAKKCSQKPWKSFFFQRVRLFKISINQKYLKVSFWDTYQKALHIIVYC